MPPQPTRGQSVALCGVCLISSAVFGWATLALPIRNGEKLQWLTGLLSAAHGVVATAAALRLLNDRSRGLNALWGGLAGLSFGAGLVFLFANAMSAYALVEAYGTIGWGLSGVLAVAAIAELLWTLPLAFWWFRTQRWPRTPV